MGLRKGELMTSQVFADHQPGHVSGQQHVLACNSPKKCRRREQPPLKGPGAAVAPEEGGRCKRGERLTQSKRL